MISFIIPALDEEKRITRVVGQFKGTKKIEVIVADGGSKDKTVRLARKSGAKVYQNKRASQNVAKNRNLGARHANGEILVFCDADTQIKNLDAFISTIKKIFKDRKVVAAYPQVRIFPKKVIFQDLFFHSLYRLGTELSFVIGKPAPSGQCQIIRKSAFEKIGGYDERITYREDVDIAKRLNRTGKSKYLKELVVYESPRRYRKGYLKLGWRVLKTVFYQKFLNKNPYSEWERVE